MQNGQETNSPMARRNPLLSRTLLNFARARGALIRRERRPNHAGHSTPGNDSTHLLRRHSQNEEITQRDPLRQRSFSWKPRNPPATYGKKSDQTRVTAQRRPPLAVIFPESAVRMDPCPADRSFGFVSD